MPPVPVPAGAVYSVTRVVDRVVFVVDVEPVGRTHVPLPFVQENVQPWVAPIEIAGSVCTAVPAVLVGTVADICNVQPALPM